MIDQLLHGNVGFVIGEFNSNEGSYRSIAAHRPEVLWIGCSDSHVSEHQMTGLKPGTMVVHLKIEDIIVCGYTRRGGIAAIEDGVHETHITDCLCIATGAKEAADRIAPEPDRAGMRPAR